MSSARYATPLRLELRPSRRLALGLALGYGGAAALVWFLPLAWGWCAPASLLIAAAGLRAGAMQLWGAEAVAAMIWGPGDEWTLLRRDGSRRRCRLLPGSYVHPQLAVLRFREETERDARPPKMRPLSFMSKGGLSLFLRTRALVLLPDGVDAEAFRRLRVRLRLEGTGARDALPLTSRRAG